MGQATSCFRGQRAAHEPPVAAVTSDGGAATAKAALSNGSAAPAAAAAHCVANGCAVATNGAAPAPPPPPPAPGALEASPALLGLARPDGIYDVSVSGPPLPPCEQERLQMSHLGDLLEHAPREELQNILALICTMFQVKNALVSLFFDRRVYIIDGTGAFKGDFAWRFSLCGWSMASEQHCVMVINDVHQDARFANNPAARGLGVRFYCGAPLISSAGHRLGTLCFADGAPRVFDDASLQLLCNFSELVTRELERDIVVAQHRAAAAPAREAAARQEQQQRYQVLLRSIDCVNSAVLLVDTSKPDWLVLHANRGWREFLQRCQQSRATRDWVTTAAAAAATQGSSSGPLPSIGGGGDVAAAAAADLLLSQPPNGGAGAAAEDMAGRRLWPLLEAQLRRDADGGAALRQRVEALLAGQEAFALEGLQLPGCGTKVALHFRSAGLSDIEGAVSICVPTWVPPPSQVAQAAAALQAGAADGAAPLTASAPWQAMYFVTVTQQQQPASAAAAATPGVAASSCGTFSVGRRGGGASGSASRGSGITLSSDGKAACGADPDGGLLVLSGCAASSCSGAGGSGACGPPSSSSPTSNSSNAPSAAPSSCFTGMTSASAAAAARAVCRKVEGLAVGGHIASGSYGHVYKGTYYGSPVAVKVLDSDSILRRESATGLCLEALLGEQLKHPNVVATLAWAIVTGKNKMARGRRLWGETLDVGRPSIAQNRVAVVAAKQPGAAGAAPPAGPCDSADSNSVPSGGHASGSARADSIDNLLGGGGSVSQSLPRLSEDSNAAGPGQQGPDCLVTGETWLVLEYCNKGCLQDAIDRGWLLERPGGRPSLLKVLCTAAEVVAGMALLHRADCVHGDLSAYNVLLSSADPAAAEAGRGFVAKVSDFGLARPLAGQSKLMTKTYGTITHMPPEMLERGLSSKAMDVYSFGVLLWQMMAGSRAWAGLSHQAVVHAVCVERRQLAWPAHTPEALAMLGQACLAHDPAERPTFRDILDVLAPLRRVLAEGLAAKGPE